MRQNDELLLLTSPRWRSCVLLRVLIKDKLSSVAVPVLWVCLRKSLDRNYAPWISKALNIYKHAIDLSLLQP